MNVDATFLYELWLGAPWGVGALSWCQVNSNWEYTYYFTHDCRRQTSERMRGQCTALSTVRRSITCDCSAVCFSYFSQMDNVCACTGHALDTSQRAARPAARRLQRRRQDDDMELSKKPRQRVCGHCSRNSRQRCLNHFYNVVVCLRRWNQICNGLVHHQHHSPLRTSSARDRRRKSPQPSISPLTEDHSGQTSIQTR